MCVRHAQFEHAFDQDTECVRRAHFEHMFDQDTECVRRAHGAKTLNTR